MVRAVLGVLGKLIKFWNYKSKKPDCVVAVFKKKKCFASIGNVILWIVYNDK